MVKKSLIVLMLFLAVYNTTSCSHKLKDSKISDNETIKFEGRIMEMVDNKNFVIRVIDGSELIAVGIHEEVTFKEDVSQDFLIGNLVGIEVGPEIMESYPLQVNLIEIYKNEQIDYIHIDQEEARRMMNDEEVIILDVRTNEEYLEEHIVDAILLPYDTISNRAEEMLLDKDATILVYCRSGNRSKIACEYLVDLGYKNIYEMGGINTWEYETVSGK